MKRLDLYILRQLALSFLFATGAVTFVILFTESFRMLSLVINNASTMWVFFQLMGLSIPTFLPLVLPLGLGAATVFTYHKLAVDSEMAVMRAVGIAPLRLAYPAIVLAVAVTLGGYLLTTEITPASQRALVQLQYKIRDSYAVFLSRPGNFNDLAEGLTFYARRRGSEGALEGILIHDVRDAATPITIMADAGKVISADNQSQMIVFNGRRQEMNMATGKLSEMAFDQYVLDLDALRNNAAKSRVPEPREMGSLELLSPPADMMKARGGMGRYLAEFHQRLSTPLHALAYCLIGLAAILVGEFNRRGMGNRIITAALCVIALQALFMSLNGVISQHAQMVWLLYATTLAPVVVCLVLMIGVPPALQARMTGLLRPWLTWRDRAVS
jgi:lipopolysaccharide export system permease protein